MIMQAIFDRLRIFQRNSIIKRVSTVLFYSALIIEILIVIIDKSAYTNPVEGRLFQITFCLFFLKLILTEYSLKEYLMIALLCLFGLWIDRAADRNEILRFAVFVASCKGIDVKKALKLTFWLTNAGCVLIMILSFTGIYGDLRVVKEYPGEYAGEITKTLYSFGMGNANAFHCMFFSLSLLGMYLYAERIKWWGYVVILAANLGLFLLTDSKTGVAISALAVVMMYLVSRLMSTKTDESVRYKAELWIGCLTVAVSVASILISVWFAAEAWKINHYRWAVVFDYGRDDQPIIFLDNLLTGRIRILTGTDNWDGALQSWRWNPVEGHEAYFDLGIVRLFYWYGIISALVIFTILILCIIQLRKKRKILEIIFISIILLYTVVEAHFISVYLARNYVLYIIGMQWKTNIKADSSYTDLV